MFLMLFQMVKLDRIAERFKEGSWSTFWKWVSFHTEHVEWTGGSLHDLIQPGFSFLVGTAMAFSIWSRQRKGQSWLRMFVHALGRSCILVALGVLLRNLRTDRIDFRFEDTLCQIGLGYTFLFLVASLPRLWSYVSVGVILVGYWGAFASYPLPPADFDYAAVGVPSEWPHHRKGFEAHWNKNSNLATAFDQWFINQFPHRSPSMSEIKTSPKSKSATSAKSPTILPHFTHNPGGYCTLNFIPTLATMILGLLAGSWLRDDSTRTRRITMFLGAIVVCWSLAYLVDALGLCPIVKRIWTPTWVLWSGAWCFSFLLFFHLFCDLAGLRAWAFPLTVIGANSIAAYVMSFATVPFLRSRIESWLHFVWDRMGDSATAAIGLTTFLIVWLILFWMFKNRIHVRI